VHDGQKSPFEGLFFLIGFPPLLFNIYALLPPQLFSQVHQVSVVASLALVTRQKSLIHYTALTSGNDSKKKNLLVTKLTIMTEEKNLPRLVRPPRALPAASQCLWPRKRKNETLVECHIVPRNKNRKELKTSGQCHETSRSRQVSE
jgi:hypothetical protein